VTTLEVELVDFTAVSARRVHEARGNIEAARVEAPNALAPAVPDVEVSLLPHDQRPRLSKKRLERRATIARKSVGFGTTCEVNDTPGRARAHDLIVTAHREN